MDPKEKAEPSMMEPCPMMFAQNEPGPVKNSLILSPSCFCALAFAGASCLAGSVTGYAFGQDGTSDSLKR